jgi:hypothetical protein
MNGKTGVVFAFVLSMMFCTVKPLGGQQELSDSELREAFVGTHVVLKIDMPGTQKGVDLNFGQGDPMEWKDYENRMREFGVALHRGDEAMVTSLVLKNDHIEFHLDGGGYGTVHDDTGMISPRSIPKSDEQVRLEKALKDTTDGRHRRELQDRIDREEARRRYLQTQENSAAMAANQIKQQEIANRRMRGGSRFNLRWKGRIPAQELSADAVRMRLAAYVDFDNTTAPQSRDAAQQPMPTASNNNDRVSAMHRGMSMKELMDLLGPGQLVSQEMNSSNLLTQEMLFLTETSRVHVTLVDSIVIRYTIESR